MPGGSNYPGPAEALESYTALVESGGAEVKGAKNPYTSRNGHMFSFLTPEGSLALRLSDDDGAEFLDSYDSGPVMSYGSVMRGYVAVPDDLFSDLDAVRPWFAKSYDWIGTLPPK